MKTAISLPDETFDRVSRRARELGMSRSEFFARAADRYLEELDRDSLTQAINDALDAGAGRDDSNAVAVAASHAALEAADDW